MAQTHQDIRNDWIRRNMKRYSVALHKENDTELIDYIERKKRSGQSTNATIKSGLQKLIETEGDK